MARKIANIYRRPDGTLQCRFSVDGRRYAVYGRTMDEVRQKEAQKRKEIEERAYHRRKEIPLADYCDWWLSGKKGTVKGSTILSYTTQIRAIKAHPIGKVLLRDLRPQHVRDLIEDRRNKVGAGSINLMILVLKCILRSAQQEQLIGWNPADGISALRAPKRARDEDMHRALTREETAAFLRAADARIDPYSDLYRLMLHTGLRIGEAIALEDRDIVGNQLHVSRTITRSGGSHIIGDGPKSEASNRVVPLDPEALRAIESAREYRAGIGASTSRIFCSRTGGLLFAQHVNEQIRKTCEAAGISPITSHALRDSFATRCAESGMQPRVLMEIMGHSSISVTMQIYVHVMDDVKTAQMLAVDFGA